MICLFARRRLGAYLDGALDAGAARAVVHHLDGCRRCRQEADVLRRMTALLRGAIPAAEPEWTGFWPGIVRGVLDARGVRPLVAHTRGRRRWVLGGAAAAALGVALTVAVTSERLTSRAGPEESPVVTAANTQYPGGTMVYRTPDAVAVVWVFDE